MHAIEKQKEEVTGERKGASWGKGREGTWPRRTHKSRV